MSNCSQCGSFIPDGQQICSMCMGDMNHGSDGYYEKWAQALSEQQGRGEWEVDGE
jgi:RNA polymerase subunit RPABC4/transcription elongation factor Spt4